MLLKISAGVRDFFALVLILNFAFAVLFFVSFARRVDEDDADDDAAPHGLYLTLASTMWNLCA